MLMSFKQILYAISGSRGIFISRDMPASTGGEGVFTLIFDTMRIALGEVRELQQFNRYRIFLKGRKRYPIIARTNNWQSSIINCEKSIVIEGCQTYIRWIPL